IGDVNDDGTIDFAASAVFSGNSVGRVRAISGANGSTLWFRSETLVSSILGYALETVDWNFDGVTDVLAGSPFNTATGGRVWVYDGADGSTLDILDPGSGTGDNFGASVAVGGDFDGDGLQDVIVGAIGHDAPGGLTEAGRVYVYTIGGQLITTIDGPAIDAELGLGLAFLGDVSVPPDGRDEIVVGRRLAEFFEGEAIVYSWNGSTATELYSVDGVGMGYNLIGDRIDGGRDVNGDGVPDFLVGDMASDEAKVFSGTDGTLLHALTGGVDGESYGTGRLIPDVDGDGNADILVGAWSNDTGANNGGRVVLHSGASGTPVRTITSTGTWYRVGADARVAGDFNGDGTTDFVLGAPGAGFNGPQPGRILVVAGVPADVPGDIDGDGEVGVDDLIALLQAWGGCIDCGNCVADLDGNCIVDVDDLILLFANWS
ncbi:MAG: hypothetical protein ACYTJ0_12080, partial [Planctomycetota bacterium]